MGRAATVDAAGGQTTLADAWSTDRGAMTRVRDALAGAGGSPVYVEPAGVCAAAGPLPRRSAGRRLQAVVLFAWAAGNEPGLELDALQHDWGHRYWVEFYAGVFPEEWVARRLDGTGGRLSAVTAAGLRKLIEDDNTWSVAQ